MKKVLIYELTEDRMKERLLCAVVMTVMLLLVCGVGCTNRTTNTSDDPEPKTATVSIDGEMVDDLQVVICAEDASSPCWAKLPLLQTAPYFGITVEQISDGRARMTCGDEVCILDYRRGELTKQGESLGNMLTPVPGATNFYCQAAESDVILDDTTWKWALELLGVNVHIHIDYEQAHVFLETH